MSRGEPRGVRLAAERQWRRDAIAARDTPAPPKFVKVYRTYWWPHPIARDLRKIRVRLLVDLKKA